MLPHVRPILRGNCVLNAYTAKAGTQVVVPYRDEDEKRHLKVMGDLGQIVPLVRSIIPPHSISPLVLQALNILRITGLCDTSSITLTLF